MTPSRHFRVLFLSIALSAVSFDLHAATPDASTLQRNIELKPPAISLPKPSRVITEPGTSAPSLNGEKRLIVVNRFVIQGATLIDEASLLGELSGFVGKSMSIDELDAAASRITAAYTRAGYLAEAFLPQQEVQDGVVIIRVVEARLGKVLVEKKPGARLRSDLATRYVTSSQAEGEYVRKNNLERGLRLLQSTPGSNSSAVIRPGSMPSTVDAVITLDNSPLFRGNLGYDNYGELSTGEHRATGGVRLESPFWIGDRLAVKALYSEGLQYGSMIYQLPLGTEGVRAGVSASLLGYKLGRDFKVLDATGNSFTSGAFVSASLISGRRSKLSGTLGFDYRRFIDDIANERVGDKNLRVLSLGLGGGLYDEFLAGGWTAAGVSIGAGSLDLSRMTDVKALDSMTARTDGSYQKLSLNVSRDQLLMPNHVSLYLSASGQLASGNLDSSEKFIIGGPYGVRAYPVSEGAGDQGLLWSMELRCQLTPAVQLFWFYDRGLVQQHARTWDGWQSVADEPNSYTLDGIGAGIQLTPFNSFLVKGTVATRMKDNPLADAEGHDHDGTRRDPRFWIEIGYEF